MRRITCWTRAGPCALDSASSGSTAATSISTARASSSRAVPLDNAQVGAAPGQLRRGPGEPAAAQEHRHQLRLHAQLRLRAGLAPGLRGDPQGGRRRGHARGASPSRTSATTTGRLPTPTQTNGYAAPRRVLRPRGRQNHPSVVMYSMSHNATGYGEDMNPDMIDGIHDARDDVGGEKRQAGPAGRGDRRSASTRAGSSTTTPRATWARCTRSTSTPTSSPSRSCPTGSSTGPPRASSPFFTCEYRCAVAPGTGRCIAGWYKGKREFGSAVVPWEFCLAEWNAQFLGDQAYRISEPEKANLRWEAEQFRDGKALASLGLPVRGGFDGFRRAVSGLRHVPRRQLAGLPHLGRLGHLALEARTFLEAARRRGQEPPGVAGRLGAPPAARLQPGLHRRALRTDGPGLRAFRLDSHGRPPRPSSATTGRCWPTSPASRARFTSKDHNFLPGETVEKQLIVINNSRETVTCDCRWPFGLSTGPISGHRTVTVAAGQQERVPLRFELPATLPLGKCDLIASFEFSTGQSQKDSFSVNILPSPTPVQAAANVALFDPKGRNRHAATHGSESRVNP